MKCFRGSLIKGRNIYMKDKLRMFEFQEGINIILRGGD